MLLSEKSIAGNPEDAQIWYIRAQVLSVLNLDGVSDALKQAFARDDTLAEVSLTDPILKDKTEEASSEVPAISDEMPSISDFTTVISE